ncbi:MAG: folate family ECF transporter S component [Ruminococcaceae bacterium]|nr:folate family ECF transporter S component [Oscillospiraceae bacterium]
MPLKAKLSTKTLVFAGLLIALEIVLTRFVQIYLPIFAESRDRISLGFLPVAVGGTLFGPVGGGIIAAVSDIVRALIFPQGGAINPLFTVTAALRGVLYGAFLYKSATWTRVLLVSTVILLAVNLGLNSAFTAFSYGGTFWARLITKLIPALSNYILQLFVLIPVLPKLERSLGKNV